MYVCMYIYIYIYTYNMETGCRARTLRTLPATDGGPATDGTRPASYDYSLCLPMFSFIIAIILA